MAGSNPARTFLFAREHIIYRGYFRLYNERRSSFMIEMSNRELECKISYLEDKLLRSRNNYEIEELRSSLSKLRSIKAKANIQRINRGF